MKDRSYEQLYSDWESYIRQGSSEQVLKEYEEYRVSPVQIPAQLRAKFAALFRRAGMLEHGLRTLAPVIRREWVGVRPSDQEVIEYCNCLRYSGLANEAFQLLISIDPEKTPDVLFNKAAYFMSRWNYAAAIEPLEQYLAMGVLDEYKTAVMKVNLAAALAESDNFDRCDVLLNDLMVECQANQWNRLLLNCHDIKTGMLVELGQVERAEDALRKTEKICVSENMIDVLFLQQRKALIESYRRQDPSPLHEFRHLANEKKHWESVRDTDLQIAKITGDVTLANHVYHGTSHYAYRKRVLKCFPSLGQYFSVNPGFEHRLNLFDGSIAGKVLLKPGHAIHKLLNSLVSDFYRPTTVGSIFNEVFSGESFDPVAGPNRIHQLLSRARAWFDESDIPLSIESENNRYQLKGECTLIKFTDDKPVSKYAVLIEKVRRHFGVREFTSKDMQVVLGVGRTEASRILGDAIESRSLEKIGAGRSTKYLFK